MPIQINSWISRLGWSALFGLSGVLLGFVGALAAGIGKILLLPGLILGFACGLIPFEGDDVGSYLLIETAFNFLFYMGCFYCVSFVWARGRTKNA